MEQNIVGSAEQFLSPCSSNAVTVFGDPVASPRVGDQYQAEIPPGMMDSCRQLVKKLTDTKVVADKTNHFALGLPVPIMWAHSEVESIKKESQNVDNANHCGAADTNWIVDIESNENRQATSKNKVSEVKPSHTSLVNGGIGLATLPSMIREDGMDVDLEIPKEKKARLDQADNACSPLPGSPLEPWTAIEHDSFLLGLYTFGKNLSVVKRFVKSKEMGNILWYYYGKFYRSNEHRRWSECRKMRGKLSIHGQKIFSGWRQQELLSRLFPHVSEKCQNMLLEVSRAFGGGRIPLIEYVFTLKDTVGINALVEAVGIGKGEQDLTGTAMDPIKANNSWSIHPEIPTGKACSSLTSGDIIKFLTGDFRLSKARSNELFWEAVWPRLLAKGWHSELPKDHGLISSKQSLMFLVPGVKNFSRRKLVKGNHYFDSVSDILNKVTSDPGLLEVESEASTANWQKEEYTSDFPVKQCCESLLNCQCHHYLQPPVTHCKGEMMKFTVVDTSLIRGGEQSKVRELRTLPVATSNLSIPSDLSSEIEHVSSEESLGEAMEINAVSTAEDTNESGVFPNSPELTRIENNGLPNGPDLTILAGKNHEDCSNGTPSDKQLKETTDQSTCLAPSMKQQLFAACSPGESSPIVDNISTEAKPNEAESPCCLEWTSLPMHEKMQSEVDPSQNLASSSSLAQDSPQESDQAMFHKDFSATEPLARKPETQNLIDLNPSDVPQDSGTDETVMTLRDLQNRNGSAISTRSEITQQSSNGGASTAQQPVLGGRRQSTRARPLTAKALEAIACGFLGTRRKRRCPDA